MRLFGLVIRDTAVQVAVWLVLLGAMCGVTPSSYQDNFPSDATRRAAVLQAADNPATLLIYGTLPSPGTPAQIFCWEMGGYAVLVASVAGVLLATRLFREWESDGRLELVRASGTRPSALVTASALWLGTVSLLIATTVAAAVGANSADGLTARGALAFGGVIGIAFLVAAAATAVAAQVFPTVEGCRRAGFAIVVLAFGLRAWGDVTGHARASWFSLLGARRLVAPFTHDRGWVLAVWFAVALGLVALAVVLQRRREYAAGLVRARSASRRRMRTGTVLALTLNLKGVSVMRWLVALVICAALMTGMGRGAVQRARSAPLDGGVLGSQLGGADPSVGYVNYLGILFAVLISIAALLLVQATVRDERDGRLEAVLCTGRRHAEPLAAHSAVALLASLLLTASSAAVIAQVAVSQLEGPDDLATITWRTVLGQWPAIALLIGVAALLVALRPRWFWLAWCIWGVSTFIALLGSALKLPSWLMRLGAFQHAPAGNNLHDYYGILILSSFSALLFCSAFIAQSRRDFHTE